MIPKEKIKVFISSACGSSPEKQKFNLVRIALKGLIESTHVAQVYLFETSGASTVSAEQHYTYALEDCDVCIFLIDNSEAIPNGVQKEIDTAKKHEIKSLYYFCDQSSKEKTPLQRSLEGEKHAKSMTVHSFEDFIKNGAVDLINDMVTIYRNYCKGRMSWKEITSQDSDLSSNSIMIDDSFTSLNSVAEKDVLDNIDQCKSYFSQLVFDYPKKEIVNTNEIDRLCLSFLPILFEGQSIIKNDSLERLKTEIKKHQSTSQYLVTEKRYEAITAYFKGDQENCIALLDEALQIATDKSLPSWLTKDILIDLRNQDIYLSDNKNSYQINSEYQKKLNEDNFLLHYPLLDRFDSIYYKKLAGNNIKNTLKSPYSVSYGQNLSIYTDLLASTFVLSIYNGSLTHLEILYDRIKTLSFYCAEKYSDWNFKLLLLKTSVIRHDKKELDNIVRYFEEILNKLNSIDANSIYLFANNLPISFHRFSAKLEAFRITGYFLEDEQFAELWKELYELIITWIENDNAQISVGTHIFSALEGACHRIEQDHLADILCKCFEHNKRRFFGNLFEVVSKCISLNELSQKMQDKLLSIIIGIIEDENKRENIHYFERALCSLRKQNRELTENLDTAIRINMPDFYIEDYCLETSKKIDMPSFIEKYVEKIKYRNDTQGEGGEFHGYSDCPHIIIKSIIEQHDLCLSDELIDSAFKASFETLMKKRQTIDTKMEAINLMVFLLKRYPNSQERNNELISELLKSKDTIETGSVVMTNLGETDLRFCALLLYNCLGEDVTTQLIEVLAYIGNDTLSQINASQELLSFLEADDIVPDPQLESIILQHSIKWCNVSNTSVRLNAVRILFQLLRNSNNINIVCNQLVKMMDTDNLYIKNSILRMLDAIKDVDAETYNYIIQKATLDTNFVVRKVAEKVCRATV